MLLLAILIACIHIGLLGILLINRLYLHRHSQNQHENPPLVSILIPARNEEENLQKLIPSLLSQRYPQFEVIIYDDDSEDNTWGIIESYKDSRIRPFKGNGPPPGWVGKVHALYQASRHASGDYYLFLDADTELLHEDALQHLVQHVYNLPERSVLTGFPSYRGKGLLLVSLVPSAVLTAIPWPLVRPLPINSLGALNGQCWMVDASIYHTYEPHKEVASEILEDVLIGRYLKSKGVTPVLVDIQKELAVYMYSNFQDAWRGFRKNAYLLLGDNPFSFAFIITMYVCIYVAAPLFSIWLLPLVFLNKLATDRISHFPFWLSLCAPLSFTLGLTLQLDSAWHHLIGQVSWKGRSVSH